MQFGGMKNIDVAAMLFLFLASTLVLAAWPFFHKHWTVTAGHAVPRWTENLASVSSISHPESQIEMDNVSKLENELSKARSAIRRAALRHGPGNSRGDSIYRNKLAFRRSYEQMEKTLKIFVYKEGRPPLFHAGPCVEIYSTEGLFIHHMELSPQQNRFITDDPEKAHLFFLPLSVTNLVSYVYKAGVVEIMRARQVFADYIDVIAAKHRYWNRTLGADHFMLSCHDWGPITSQANKYLETRSIRVLCNANTSEGFDPARDASLPEMKIMRAEHTRIYNGRPRAQRDILAFFAGGAHGYIRSLLFQHWRGKDPDMHVFEYLPEKRGRGEFNTTYNEYLGRARFCLCPSGYEVASPRIVEAIYSGCVPVVISWSYWLPFSEVLNWQAFSLSVPPEDIPWLKHILMSVPESRYAALRKGVLQVQKHFRLHYRPQKEDMLHMLLHSVWLRRLNVRLRG